MTDPRAIDTSQLTALYQVSKKINSELRLKPLLEDIMDLAVGLLHAEKGLILFRDAIRSYAR